MTRLTRRRALLIGNENHDDGRFAALPSARADTWQFQQILEHRNIGAFMSVRSLSDLAADDMRYEIGEFLEERDENEMALLYISGHGTRLVQDGGEFHFVARDTDFDRVAETSVSAGFVNELLEQCAAPQKIVMIDCCRSGGFSVGFRTADGPAAKSGEAAPLTSRGVYVLSSSRAGEDSYAGAVDRDLIAPSAFTGEVVEALRTGKAGRDGTGEVSIDALFEYVNRRMRANGARQIPVKSAQGVDDRMIIAGCPLGAAPRLVPLSPKPADPRPAAPQSPQRKASSQVTWPDLLKYYRECVLSDQKEPPLLSVDDAGKSYVCLPGSERIVCGDLDDDHCVPLPPGADEFVAAAAKDDAELWAGYPAVVLHDRPGARREGVTRFAPLLVRPVEIVHGDGGPRLRPYGPVLPHPQLARRLLGEEEAAELIETYRPSWHGGQQDRMAVDVRNLLETEYALPCVQEPRPHLLADRVDVATPSDGARNAAVLFAVPPKIDATGKLLKDLGDIERKADRIKVTALASLSPEPVERAAPERPVRLVTPLACNEAQAAVLRSAMTNRLTVATGPPGTGKSQLVTNLVATAQAAGQKVLVASTNNEAVDEVYRRCERTAPGSIVRTGASRYRTLEETALNELSTLGAPTCNVETAQARLDKASQALDATRDALARTATTERNLRRAGEDRETHAENLALPVSALLSIPSSPADLARKAERGASARFLGEWRRNRLLDRLRIPIPPTGTAAACLSLAAFADAETRWRAGREHAADAPPDDALVTALHQAEADLRDAASVLLDSTVRAAATRGRHHVIEILKARAAGGTDWPAVRAVLSSARAWAVTSLSARRFPPDPALFDLVIIDEASQCAIPHILPLLFRARRALIIGDVMQLAHIAKIGAGREATIRRETGLRASWLEKHHLGFRRHSGFHAAERAAGGALLLDEHFRCHPDIAALVNHRFYAGRLNVLTDVRGRPALPERPAIMWSDVAGRAVREGTSWVNHHEVGKVLDSVRYLLATLPADATVGVVTPFKAQADAVRKGLPQGDGRVRVGTVHVFQGGERDVMVFSLVAGTGMREGSIRWVDRQLTLWNVAITRARSHLIVVGDSALWAAQGGVGAALRAASDTAEDAGANGHPDHLVARLFTALSSENPDATVDLGRTVNGHRADALLRHPGRVTPVLLDPGPPDDADATRHLRLMLHRRDLLATGTSRADRRPAWTLHETDPS